MNDAVEVLIWAVVAIVGTTIAVRIVLRLLSAFKLWRAADRPLHSTQAVLWRDPGPVEELDLAAGPGGPDGAPAPPFQFLEEHGTGSRPNVSVRDARGRTWRVKWGDEVQVETLATRLAWAAGYFVETNYYVESGRIDGASSLQRASSCIDPDGRFEHARFELDEPNVIKHFEEHSWSWNDNPFLGTRELNGLKIVMMWLSNWDAKDVRDVALGSNTAIFEYPGPHGRREARYLIIDWGGALGKWGSVVTRGRWDCEGFAAQTPALVQDVKNGYVQWGYTGQHTADITRDIRVDDVRWLMQRLGRLRPEQMAGAVGAAGGTPEDISCFSRQLHARLARLSDIA